jgi:rubredoxin
MPTKVQGKKTKIPAKKTARTNVKPVANPAKRVPGRAAPKKSTVKPKKSQSGAVKAAIRYKCRICGYIYSSLRGEPHNGIPAGTAFDDLPDTYVCPVCGFQAKGKIGKWGFDEWRPTRYLCSMCEYIYDEARGEPHRGIKAGTRFEDLPDDYVCPVCALDPKFTVQFGKVLKQGFSPIDV